MDYNITYRKKDNSIQVVVQYKDGNKWRKKSKQGFEDSREGKKKAKIAAEEMVKELKQKITLNIDDDIKQMTIGQLKVKFLDHIKLHREYNTYENYRHSLNKFNLDEMRVVDVKTNDIQECINKLVGMSENTIDRRLNGFKAALKFYTEQYHLPLNKINKISYPETKAPKEKKALTEKEQKQVLKHYYLNNTQDYYTSVLLALTCGLRIGEITGLTWNDINLEEGFIDVNKQWKINSKTLKYGFGELKRKNSYRTVPIPKKTLTELKRIKHGIKVYRLENRIINSESTKSLSVNLDRHLQRNFGICIHELRHTYATTLISNGLDLKTVAALIGDDIEQVMKTYSHVNSDMLDKAKKLIDNIL